jgi:hypothetical protein
VSDNEKTIGRWGVSEHQPIDLDDLRRVSVKVRWMTDDNWLADMVELACDEISRLREDNDEQCRLHGVGSQRELRQLAVIEEQAREIARLREERRWVPVGERLPPVGQDEKVLVAWRYQDEPKEEFVVSESWHLRLGLFLDKEEFEFPGVKFWMPLPPGPEGDG